MIAAPHSFSFTAPAPRKPQNQTRKALLDRLHHPRRIALLRLTDQQVYVFRHDDVTHDHKTIALAHLLEDFEELIAAAAPSPARAGDDGSRRR